MDLLDLGAATPIDRVIFKWHSSAAKEFKIQTSTDSENWTDVYSTSQGSSTTVTDETFETTTARYVRMYGTKPRRYSRDFADEAADPLEQPPRRRPTSELPLRLRRHRAGRMGIRCSTLWC